MATARKIALDALVSFEENNSYSNIALNGVLKDADLIGKDKAFVTTLFYGVIEKKITLDYIIKSFSKGQVRLKRTVRQNLRMALYQILYLDKIPHSAAVNEALKLLDSTKHHYAKGFTNALLRNVVRSLPFDLDFSNIEDKFQRLSLKYSFPLELIEFFEKSYPNIDVEELICGLSEKSATAIRVNTLKTDIQGLKNRLLDKGISVTDGHIGNCLILKNYGSLEALDEFTNGLFHIEDESAQLSALSLNVKENDVVLDVCSAPGGKAFTIAEIMNNRGKIVANDVYPHKLKLIKSGAKRLGIDIIETSMLDASKETFEGEFDRILCDVPCSGFGIIRKKPEIRYKSLESLDFLPELQYLILCNASISLKSGGYLVYSTCTLNPKENEQVISKFTNQHTHFKTISEKTYFPHIDKGDGFYIAVLKKNGEEK